MVSMTSSYSRAPELPSLTGLRFWAAYSILLNHLLLGFVARDNVWLGNMLQRCGELGMDVFFILSGFIIHYNYHAKLRDFSTNSFYEFMVARFSRLYPLFILFFCVEIFTLSGLVRYSLSELLWSIPTFLTMSQSWFYWRVGSSSPVMLAHMFDRASIAWSISTEFLMYCGYPLLLLVIVRDRLGNAARIISCLFIWIGGALLMRYVLNNPDLVDAFAVRWIDPAASTKAGAGGSFYYWFAFVSPYFRFIEFTMGVAAGHLFLSLHDRPVGTLEGIAMPLLGLLSLVVILLMMLPLHVRPGILGHVLKYIGFYPFITCIVFVCARYDYSILTKFFEIRFFVFFGEVSYSMYLIHIFFYGMVSFSPTMPQYLLFAQIISVWVFIFACSYILYMTLEMPARRWLRDLLTRRKAMPRGAVEVARAAR
jgi:peptidoglycan/LPS O-acetylase OafA/YrhL